MIQGCSEPPEPAGWSVHVIPATHRVERDQRYEGGSGSINLYAARNEVEPFQLVIRASQESVRGIQVE